MPLRLDIESRAETIRRSVNHILVIDGVKGLTMRRIAQQSRISTGSLLHHFGTRERLLRVAALTTGRLRLDDIGLRCPTEGACAFLPTWDEEVRDLRAWLGWLELWRSEEWLRGLAPIQEDERHLLARSLDHQLRRDDLDALAAMVHGLRLRICAPEHALPPLQARTILGTHAQRLVRAAV